MKKTAIVLLVTVALLFVLRQFVVVPYSVPYEGMEPTLGEGERVLVNKWGYGSSSSDKAKTVERGAIMVFHNPAEKPDVAIDDRAVFIARIYGLAGDTLMLNRQLVPVDVPPVDVHLKRVYHYPALCEERMLAIVDSLGIKDSFVGNGQSSHSRQFNYDEILKVRAAINRAFTLVCTSPDVPTNCYPYVVPKKNGVVPVTLWNITLLCNTINYHEGRKAVIKNGQLFVDGKLTKQYTFTQNYYWVMCDNMLNLNDSRLFGIVPESHLVGKVWMVYWKKIRTI